MSRGLERPDISKEKEASDFTFEDSTEQENSRNRGQSTTVVTSASVKISNVCVYVYI
jgi:hypothetical protein